MAKHAATADDVIILYVCVLIIEVGENRGNCICATLVNCLRVQTQGSVMRNDFLFIVRNYVHTYIHAHGTYVNVVCLERVYNLHVPTCFIHGTVHLCISHIVPVLLHLLVQIFFYK